MQATKAKDGESTPEHLPVGTKSKDKDASSPDVRVPASSPGGSSRGASGGTVQSNATELTVISEDMKGKDKGDSPSLSAPASPEVMQRRANKRGRAPGSGRAAGSAPGRKKVSAAAKTSKSVKLIKKTQAKHKRSFCSSIYKILKDVNPLKRISPQAMMIHDSFANDLCDKVIAASNQLVAKAQKKRLGTIDVIAALKLVLPPDMAVDCEKCIEQSIISYRTSTENCKEQIQSIDKLKAKITGKDKE